MKIIIYITALICSLLASPALATETGQISITNMGLKVIIDTTNQTVPGETIGKHQGTHSKAGQNRIK